MMLALILGVAILALVLYGVWMAGELGVGPELFPKRRPRRPEPPSSEEPR